MIQAELEEEKEQIEDLENQRVDYLNRAERIAERLTALKTQHKEHLVEAQLAYIVKNCDKLGYSGVVKKVEECLEIIQNT